MEEILMEAAEAEAVEILIGLRDLVPAATPEPAHRRIFPRWERKRRRSKSNNNKSKKATGRERLSPATPLSFCHSGGDDTTTTTATAAATKILRKMSQHKQWLKEQKQLIDSLISTKINLQKSVEEAKRQCQMLRERNCWLRSLHAGAEIKLRRQQQQAFNLNRSAAAAAEEEARLAWQRQMQLSAQARKRRRLLQRAKFSPSSSLSLWR